jgi:hypothetical protein
MRRHPELCDTTAAQLHILILDMSVWQYVHVVIV